MIYYSAKTKGFYPTEAIGKQKYEQQGSWPSDATEISIADYEKYLSSPPEGMELGSTKQGKPTWVPISEQDKDTAKFLATIKKQQLMADAEETIAILARAVKLGMATDAEAEQLEAWERYSVLLSRIDVNPTQKINWPEVPVKL